MINTLTNQLRKLEVEFRQVNEELNSSCHNKSLKEKKNELNEKIQYVKSLIEKRNSNFLIKTKQGYLSANGNFTDNINLAYTFSEEEAVSKAKVIDGWLEELPESDLI